MGNFLEKSGKYEKMGDLKGKKAVGSGVRDARELIRVSAPPREIFLAADTAAIQQVGVRILRKRNFGGFRISLTAKPSSRSPRPGYIQRAFSAYAMLYFTLRTKRNYAHCVRSVTAFQFLATRNSQLATR